MLEDKSSKETESEAIDLNELGEITVESLLKLNKEFDTAKADFGKPRLSLVPRQIIFDIAKIREYGCKKYKDPDNWKRVEASRYRDAAFRHFMAYLDDPGGVDSESGLPHLAHLACNIAFLCELEKDSGKDTEKSRTNEVRS